MFKNTWEPFFNKFPDIQYEFTGQQNEFDTFVTAFVPQEYLNDPAWNDHDLAMNLGFRNNYWGGSVERSAPESGGKRYFIGLSKE